MILVRLENQVWAKTWPGTPTQACRFQNFFLAPFRNLFLRVFHRISWKVEKTRAEKSSGMGPRKGFRNLQAWLGMTWLSCNLHFKPLPKCFPPRGAAAADDLAQAFDGGLRRRRQQPT